MSNLGKLTLLAVLLASPACYERREHATKPAAHPTGDVDSCDGSTCADSGSDERDERDERDETNFARHCKGIRPEMNPDEALCTSGTLEDFCAKALVTERACPQTLDEAIAYVCSLSRAAGRYHVLCNACGGANVMVPWGFGGSHFSFDAGGKPVGAALMSDGPIGLCGQHKTVFGKSCATLFEDGLLPSQPCPNAPP
jgi:hypothetical protein